VKQRFLPTKLHAGIDFATCGLWFAGPEVFKMKWTTGSSVPSKVYGTSVLVNAICTDFGPAEKLEWGGARVWSFRTHFKIDLVGSATVAALPWITGTRKNGWNYWAPQLGAAALVWLAAFTTKVPGEDD
jgi:hypothetical protein